MNELELEHNELEAHELTDADINGYLTNNAGGDV